MNNDGTCAGRADVAEKSPEELEVLRIAGQFQTIEELFADGHEANNWLVKRLVPSESIVTLQGQAKSGKTTFLLHMIKELIRGGEFLGEKLNSTGVVYVTEQNRRSFLSQLNTAGLDSKSGNLVVLTVERTLGFASWRDLFQACETQVRNTGSKLLVIDSWGRFTGITEQEENKAAPVQERITELRKIIKSTGASIFILHHVRKSGGNIIDAGMSSSALAQQVDVVLSLSGQPTQEDVAPNRVNGPECRMIQSKSRYTEVMNNEQVKWERQACRYVLAGGPVQRLNIFQALLDLIPVGEYRAVNATELANRYSELHADAPVASRTVENHFSKLKKEPSVRVLEGTGVRGRRMELYKEQ